MKNQNKNFKKYFLKNTLIQVGLVSSSGNLYDSRIEDVDDKTLTISMPTQKGRPVPVVRGSVLNISFIADNGRITFDTKVENVIKEEDYRLVVSMPPNIRYEQMRQFYRIPVRLKASIWHGSLHKMPLNSHMTDVTVVDLSGGGCKFISQEDIKIGDSIVINFEDSIPDVSLVQSRVVRIITSGHTKQICVNFEDISENNRDKIVRYVFRRQMELRDSIGSR